MTTAIKTALVGLGFSGQTFHLPFLKHHSDFDLTTVMTSQAGRAKQLVPTAQAVSSMDELIASQPELVIITAPNDQHFALAEQALQAGCHVVLEKPFVTSSAEGEALIKRAEQQQKVLSVYHNRRYDGDFLTLQKLISEKTLGQTRLFESHFDRFRPEPQQRWREQAGAGTGFLFDLGSHLIDQALVLFGWPNTITAQVLALRPGAETTDYFHLVLGYNEHQVILHSSPFCASPNHRFQLHGSKGSYQKWGLDPQEERLRAGIQPNHPDWGKETPAAYGDLYLGERQTTWPTETGNYHLYFDQLATAIRGDAELQVTAKQALDVIRLIELAEQSAEQQRTLACQS